MLLLYRRDENNPRRRQRRGLCGQSRCHRPVESVVTTIQTESKIERGIYVHIHIIFREIEREKEICEYM